MRPTSRTTRVAGLCLLAVLALSLVLSAHAATAAPATSALVLCDSKTQWGWLGDLYATQLTNLLSHFQIPVTRKAVKNYAAGDIERYGATFYVGAIYGEALPAAFKAEVMATNKPVCWIGLNLRQIAQNATQTAANPAFTNRFGFRYVADDTTGYPVVTYNGYRLTKEIDDPMISKAEITNSALAQAVAMCTGAKKPDTPYIVHGANLWYVVDMPFSYVSDTDRYLAFADILHDVLDIAHPARRRAYLRIEDISPASDPVVLRTVIDYLASEGVPFGISLIPEYRDPLGAYNRRKALTIKLAQRPEMLATLLYATQHGGEILQHGYTHQYSNLKNPYGGVSGEDYEFYRVTLNSAKQEVYRGPVPEDSQAWARNRVNTGRTALLNAGLTPVAWNTPHYIASNVDYKAFRQVYAIAMDRPTTYVTAANGALHSEGQLVPYVLYNDQYGFTRIPETIGYLDPWNAPLALPAALLARATANQAVRDGWAGCYYHPDVDLVYLQDLIAGLKAQGYQFTNVAGAL